MKKQELKNKVKSKLESIGYCPDTIIDMLNTKLFEQAINRGYKAPKQIALYICNFH